MKGLALVGVAAGWILILLAGLALGFELPVLYLLLTDSVAPGQFVMGDPAPTKEQSAIFATVDAAVIGAGFVLKAFAGKYRRGKAT